MNETYPLFLRCGRQLGPQFRTPAQLAAPSTDDAARFVEQVERECVALWRRGWASSWTAVSAKWAAPERRAQSSGARSIERMTRTSAR